MATAMTARPQYAADAADATGATGVTGARSTRVGDLCRQPAVRIDAQADLVWCALLMREAQVGCVIVTRSSGIGEQAIGIVTDRDIAVGALAEGLPPTTPVARLARRPVAVLRASDDVLTALALMRAKGLQRLGVIDDGGDLVGVLALDDLLPLIVRPLQAIAGAVVAGQRHDQVEHPHEPGLLFREEPPVSTVP